MMRIDVVVDGDSITYVLNHRANKPLRMLARGWRYKEATIRIK